jgi:hypothetical protein
MREVKVKALRVSDFPEDAWIVLGSTGTGTDKELDELYESVDYLYRGITLRAQKLASVPWVVTRKGGADFYDSESEQPPPVGFEWLLDLPLVLEKIEAAVCLGGRAYVMPLANEFGFIKELQWCKPTSIDPWYDVATGELLHFKRHMPAGLKRVEVEDLVYFWPPDPTVETGPARRYPGRAAMAAAGVLANMDKFLEHYFGRGAIKVTLLTTEGVVKKSDRDLLKTWWQKVTNGIKSAFGSEVINANKVTPVVIGEGVHDLENSELTAEKREAICAALGVPPSKVIPNAANYATKQSDDVMLVSDTVTPELRWLARVLNKQLFDALGLAIQFRPSALPEMQVDENERSLSLVNLTTAGMPLLLACEQLGYDLDKEWIAKLEAAEERKEEMAEAGAEALAQGVQQMDQKPGPADGDTEKSLRLARRLDEAARLERWLRNDPTRDPADFQSEILDLADRRRVRAIVDGKLIPSGQPIHLHVESPAELGDAADIARLVTDVEKWAQRHGLDLDKMLNAELDEFAPDHD